MKKTCSISKTHIWIAVSVLLAILLTVFVCIRLFSDKNTDISSTEPNPTSNTQNELRLPDLLGTAKAIKSELISALHDIKASNWDAARSKLVSVQSNVVAVQAWFTRIPLLIDLVPQAENIRSLLDTADMAISDILLPMIDLMESRPLSSLKVANGFDAKLLCEYIAFAESVMPKLESCVKAAESVDFSIIDSEGKIAEYLDTANQWLDFYQEYPESLSLFKAMLGQNENRLYLIAVQNPSEIRASGGFPGFMGTIRIEEGILTLGEFSSVRNFLTNWTPKNVTITQEERSLFNYLSGIHTPRDADLCPNFERVGLIWASSYEERHKESVAGVISVTPHIVQRFLAATGEEIQLSDGLVMNGDNATKVLIHDIYFKYFDRREYYPNKYIVSDMLFAEAASKTMSTITDHISISRLMALLPIMKESISDRTLMLWMKDPQEQDFAIRQGWSGGLNQDPQNPQAGIYVNVVSASKMGWFLLMDTEMGERTENPDGSYTYPITVTFTNNITQEEINAADTYISGGLGGSMRGVVYFFAPAGGSVDNFTASNGHKIKLSSYNGMTLGFMDQFLIRPNQPITVTYTVTTAPGVDTPLVFSKTPTAQ